jgi:hypothetical protein
MVWKNLQEGRYLETSSSVAVVICVSFSSVYGPARLVQAGALRFTYNICQVSKVCIKLMTASFSL